MHFWGIFSIDGCMFGTPQNQKCILFSTTKRVSETTQKQNNSSYPELSGDMRFVGVLTDSSRTPGTPFYGGLYAYATGHAAEGGGVLPRARQHIATTIATERTLGILVGDSLVDRSAAVASATTVE